MLVFRYIVAAFNLLVAAAFAIMAATLYKEKGVKATAYVVAAWSMANLAAICLG